MNPYRRGLRNGVLVNPKLFIFEKVNLAPPTNGWSNLVKLSQTWSNLLKTCIIWYGLLKIDYGCGPSSGPVLDTGAYGDDDACAYEEGNDESVEDVDDEYDDDLHVQADGHVSSFQTTNQVLENERGIFVSAHALSCDVSNTADDDEGPDESAPIQYHLPLTPCFEHVENIDIAISSGWTPWGQETTSYASDEFVVGQVFNSKSELQEAAKIY